MLEHCERCQDYAPAWDHPEYADWYVALTETGDYLGVICPGCFAGHDLVFIGLEVAPASPAWMAGRPSRRRTRRPARSSRAHRRRPAVRAT
jgi:hypothetical protein